MQQLLLVALTLLLAISGCSSVRDTIEDTSDEATLAGLSGVQTASVRQEAYDDDYYERVVVVDLESEVTAEQVTAVLDEIDRIDPYEFRVYLDAGSTDMALPLRRPRSSIWSTAGFASNSDAAQAWTTALAAYPGAIAAIEYDGVQVEFPGGTVDDVTDALRTAVDDAELADLPLSFRATRNAPGASFSTAYVGGVGAPTRQLLQRWQRVADAVDQAHGVDVGLVHLEEGPGAFILLDLSLPSRVPKPELTTGQYGEVLWPVLRPVLDVLAGYDAGEIQVSVDDRDRLFTLVLDRQPRPADRWGRTWAAEAAAYVAQQRD